MGQKKNHFAAKLSLYFYVLALIFFIPVGNSYPLVALLKFAVIMTSIVLSIVFAITFFVFWKCQKKRAKGLKIAVFSFALSALTILLIFFANQGIKNQVHIPHAQSLKCQENMKEIYQAFLAYAEVNDGVLPGSNWCDILISDKLINPEVLICPSFKESCTKSNYILNADIAGKNLDGIEPDIVILYEGDCGWNQMQHSFSPNKANHIIAGIESINVLYQNGKVANKNLDLFTSER